MGWGRADGCPGMGMRFCSLHVPSVMTVLVRGKVANAEFKWCLFFWNADLHLIFEL